MSLKEEFNSVLLYIQKNKKLDKYNYRVVCRIYSKVFNKKYFEPCTCNPKTINGWINSLKKHFEV